MDVEEVFEGTRIFSSRFVGTIKTANMSVRYKSQLVAQRYGDTDSNTIAMTRTTIKHFTDRFVISLAASLDQIGVHTRDVPQAYAKYLTSLERDVYIRSPAEMNVPSSKVIKVAKPLYRISEPGLHWCLTHTDHHSSNLGM